MKFKNQMELIDFLKSGKKLRKKDWGNDTLYDYIHLVHGNIVDQYGEFYVIDFGDLSCDWEEYTPPKLSHKACSAVERLEWIIDMFKKGNLKNGMEFKITSTKDLDGNGKTVVFIEQTCSFIMEDVGYYHTRQYDIEEI